MNSSKHHSRNSSRSCSSALLSALSAVLLAAIIVASIGTTTTTITTTSAIPFARHHQTDHRHLYSKYRPFIIESDGETAPQPLWCGKPYSLDQDFDDAVASSSERRDAKTLFSTPLIVSPSLSYFTHETEGNLIVEVSTELPVAYSSDSLYFSASYQDEEEATTIPLTVVDSTMVEPGSRRLVPFDLTELPLGEISLKCELKTQNNKLVAAATVTVTRLKPAADEVKIDYWSRGLLANGVPVFPFGFYFYWPPIYPMANSEVINGFMHVHPYMLDGTKVSRDYLEFLEDCGNIGLRVVYDLHEWAQTPPSSIKSHRIQQLVGVLKNNSALLGYYIADEPDGQGINATWLGEMYDQIKSLDPYHPVLIVLNCMDLVDEYIGATDILMTDPYPIGLVNPVGCDECTASVTDVSARIDRYISDVKASATPNMPVWLVPQAFGNQEWWSREPTPQEERVMTYLAVIHGATGIQYFSRAPPIQEPNSQMLWAECTILAQEFFTMAPWLLSTENDFPSLEVSSSSPSVHCRAWQHGGYVLILVVNTVNEMQPLSIKLTGAKLAPNASATVLFENRVIPLSAAGEDFGMIQELAIGAFSTRAYLVPTTNALPSNGDKKGKRNLIRNPSFEVQTNAGWPDSFSSVYDMGGSNYVGASAKTDGRVAYDGLFSLRLITGYADATRLRIQSQTTLTNSTRFEMSVWVHTGPITTGSLQIAMGIQNPASANLWSNFNTTAASTTGWEQFTLSGTIPPPPSLPLQEATTREQFVNAFISLNTPGTIWVDLFELVPLD